MVKIGVDLGGTNIVVGVVNENYEILAKTRRKTRAERSAEEIMQDMAQLCREAAKRAEAVLKANKKVLDKLAEELLAHETLEEKELEPILKDAKLPEIVKLHK